MRDLELRLKDLSHSSEALEAIRQFAAGLRDTRERLAVLNADSALVRSPILADQTRALGFDKPEDDFTLLQGDVVVTESAFFLGERIAGNPKYIVLSSS